jgi:hypothetical protein
LLGISLARTSFLSKYETLSKLFYQLTEELDRSVTEVGFQNFLLQPKGMAEDPELVPNLLRTKLEPEVERDLEALQKQCADEMGGEQPSMEAIEKRILMFNAFVSSAMERFEDARTDLLESPRPEEPEPAPVSARAQALLTALSAGEPLPL